MGPASRVRKPIPRINRLMILRRRRRKRFVNGISRSARAVTAPPKYRFLRAAVAVPVRVMATAALPSAFNATVLGDKDAETPPGNPLTFNVTGEAKPF